MPKAICIKCKVEYKPLETGAYAAEMFKGNNIYKIWSADIWQCPICKNKIALGFAQNPIAHHFETEKVEKLKDGIKAFAYENASDAINYRHRWSLIK